MCVLFTSNRPLERAENIKAVYDAYDGEKQYVQMAFRTPIPDMHSGRYRLMVTDELLNDSPGKMLFIGHGAGAGKTYGLDQPRPYFSRSELITYAIASSKTMVPLVARQLGISEGRVMPLGFPRMDAYFRERPELQDKPFWLFAPTFRRQRLIVDWNTIHRHMPEDRRLIVKPHMIQTHILDESVWQGIDTAPASIPSTPFLLRMDALVTDYSSIMFDAMVLRKPYVLFARDREDYLRTRGMYYLYPEDYSTRFCEREADLIPMLMEAEWDDWSERFRDFYVGACDGRSAERTADLIKSMI